MDIEVEQITIIIDTNRPNKSKNDLLTKHIFYGYNSSYKDKFYEEFPFFTKSVKIPKDYLRRRTFDEKIMFFFNRKTFVDTLSNKSNKYSFTRQNDGNNETKGGTAGDGYYGPSEDNVDDEEMITDNMVYETSICDRKQSEDEKYDDEVVQYNLATMIELLFTTVYPSVNDNSDSFNKLVMKQRGYTLSLDGTVPKLFKSMIPSLNVEFSYIILDGKDYTVTSTCILNDIINHPEYNKMIHKLVEFKKWKIQTINEIRIKMTNIKKKIRFNIKNNFSIDNKIITEKIFVEIAKNTRNFSYYEPNIDMHKKSEILESYFVKFLSNIDNDVSTFDTLKDIKRQLNNKYSFQVINSLIDEILMMMIIKTKFFDPKTNEHGYDVISGEIEKYFKVNYSKYAELITYVSGFVLPNRISSNRILQCMINAFSENKNDKLEKTMNEVFERYINDDVDNTQRMTEIESSSLFTGVNSYNTANNFGKLKYEAYVSFNLISGKLTHEDLSNISCEYKDEELGSHFDNGRSDKLIKSTIHISTLIDREKMIKNVSGDAKVSGTKVSGGKRKRRNTKKKRTVKSKINSIKKKTMKCRSK